MSYAWTEEQNDLLRSMNATGATKKAIAAALSAIGPKRTASSVGGQKRVLGIADRAASRNKYVTEAHAEITPERAAKMDAAFCAAMGAANYKRASPARPLYDMSVPKRFTPPPYSLGSGWQIEAGRD